MALFWWRYFNIRPFSPDWTRLEEVVEFGGRNPVRGFNRECIRSYIFWRLHEHLNCTSFVETGTMYGNTTGFVNRVFDTPVFTSEINDTYYLVNRANLIWARGVTNHHSNSVEFLNSLCDGDRLGDNPMFYLDAHWYDYMPLADELCCIIRKCRKAVILIDDFMIPNELRYRYDEYPDVRIDMALIRSAFKGQRQDYGVYLPNYDPDLDPTGLGIGFAVVLVGQEENLSTNLFPFDLLDKTE